MSTYRRVSIVGAATVCVVFSLVFAILVVAAKLDRNPFDELVLVNVGSALLGAGLVVVLVQTFMMVAGVPSRDQSR